MTTVRALTQPECGTSDASSTAQMWHPVATSVQLIAAPVAARGSLERKNPPIWRAFASTATGIRTPVSAVRGRCPSPLDDGGASAARIAKGFTGGGACDDAAGGR